MGQDFFYKEALYSHGPLARRILLPWRQVPNADYEALLNLPCTRRVLEQAVGIISHSAYNLQLARNYYPEGLLRPHRIIPHVRAVGRITGPTEKSAIKAYLGFRTDDVIIATFGHIAFTKMYKELLEAFLGSPRLCGDKNICLVFVGKPGNDAYGNEISVRVAENNLNGRIKITGYVNDKDYENFLSITDIAVQLREFSRGETSGACLYSLAYGNAVIVNNYATYADYPSEIMYKLSEHPDIHEIRQALEKLCDDPELRLKLGRLGREFVNKNHSPELCAAQYADAIHDFYDRQKMAGTEQAIEQFSFYLKPDSDNINLAGKYIAHKETKIFRKKRLYVDVSFAVEHDYKAGIQHVVSEIVRNLYSLDIRDIEPIAVELKNGKLLEAVSWLNSNGMLLTIENEMPPQEVVFVAADILFMLDSSWARYAEFYPFFNKIKEAGGFVYTAVYDLLPLTLPSDVGGTGWFANWLHTAVLRSDALVCTARANIIELTTWIHEKMPGSKVPPICYCHHGADFTQEGNPDIGDRIHSFLEKKYLLVVGTIEPRKNHALALEAFDILWRNNCELFLCIAGSGQSWSPEGLVERLRNSNKDRSKLIFIEKPTDVELAALYSHAQGLLFPSKGEGFGLPVIEAAHYGIPILCSDIPVFHEIAGEHATYIRINDADCLAEDIRVWWEKAQQGQIPDSSHIPVLTWEESTKQLLQAMKTVEQTITEKL